MSVQPYREPVPLDQRRWLLDREIGVAVAGGASVAYRTWDSVVLTYGQPTNHAAHAIVSVFLCGLWLPFWALFAIVGGQRRVTMWVDEYGQVQHTQGASF